MLRTLGNTCDHCYDIVITQATNTDGASCHFLNGNFSTLPVLERFSTACCFHPQLWLTCMYRAHLTANTLLKEINKTSTICKNL